MIDMRMARREIEHRARELRRVVEAAAASPTARRVVIGVVIAIVVVVLVRMGDDSPDRGLETMSAEATVPVQRGPDLPQLGVPQQISEAEPGPANSRVSPPGRNPLAAVESLSEPVRDDRGRASVHPRQGDAASLMARGDHRAARDLLRATPRRTEEQTIALALAEDRLGNRREAQRILRDLGSSRARKLLRFMGG